MEAGRRRQRRKKKRDHTNAAATTISDLPNHIVCDILSRLPLKSIFTCKRVCSSFRNLTLDPCFPRLHLPRSPLSLIHFRRSDSVHPISFGFLPLDDLRCLRRSRSTMKFETQIEIPLINLRPVSSSDGLICLADFYKPDNVCVCNPVTRQYFILPVLDEGSRTYGYGFGYSQSTHHFKVVKFTVEGQEPPFRLHRWVYTLGVDDEWRSLGDTGQSIPNNRTFVFLNGALHWIGRQDSKVLLCYFDMGKEQFGNRPMPNFSVPSSQVVGLHLDLGVVDNCLYILHYQTFQLPVNIWVMKDYENIDSWTLEWIIQRPLPSRLDGNLRPFLERISCWCTKLPHSPRSSMNGNVKILNSRCADLEL
ncbi:hypothetical protein Vadar_014916 [Vaccinium darrowii]|uniref:Uncharacterized protein n=1 Tax=Vaccinium darrowii TaxID=229202 RepID=A0ACB7XQV0_9ERIC|nr:hypothetical protein Vadar_014916 [Vaccinium darrowii]